MSSHDKRYDKNAPWKSQSGSGKDSPERYRKRNGDSPTRRYNSYKDRRYYDNRGWNYTPFTKRNSNDYSRYRYERKPETSDEKRKNEGEKYEILTTEGWSRNFTNKRTWSSSSSSHVIPNPEKTPCIFEHQPLKTNPALAGTDISAPNKFELIFQHINAVYSQNVDTHVERPMSFIDRIIADEAMRMISAASSSEATSLNEPCITAEPVSNNAPINEETETSKQEAGKAGFDSKINDKVVTVSATNSELLQKSAEQVTKKLINQLSTMNKYDLKHMIDNPAGKYQTALNRHAQSKLRSEVRKQLKSFGLGKLGNSCVTGDGTVESDEVIDASKIPSALLAQIGQVLDMNFFDIPSTESSESIEQLPDVVENSQSNSIKPEPNGEHEPQSLLCSTSSSTNIGSADHVVTDQPLNVTNVSGPSRPMKNTNSLKWVPKTPHHKSNDATIRLKGLVCEAVASTLQPKVIKPVLKKKCTLLDSKKLCDENSKNIASSLTKASATITPAQSLKYVSQTHKHPMTKDTDMDLKKNSMDNIDPLTPGEQNSGVKNVSFLRVSTVEELNSRLDDCPGIKTVESKQVPELDQQKVISEKGLSRVNVSNPNDRSANLANANLDSISSATDEIYNLKGVNHPAINETLKQGTESTVENRANAGQLQNSQIRNNNEVRAHSPDFFRIQHLKQLIGPNVSPPVDQTELMNNKNVDNLTKNILGRKKSAPSEGYMMNQKQEKHARISMDPAVEITNTTQPQNLTPKVSEGQPMAPVAQVVVPALSSPVQLPVKKKKKAKKRKIPMQNDCASDTFSSSVASNNVMASTPGKVKKMVPICVTAVTNNGQINEPSCTANMGKKRKKGKAKRFASINNTGNANNETAEPLTTTTERIPSHQSIDVLPNEDPILNNAHALETMEQQTRITIANVCSIASSEDMNTSATVVTETEATGKNSPDLQLTQEIFLAKPEEEITTTSQHLEQSIPNFALLDNCSAGNLSDWNLPTESRIAESKEEIERIASPPPTNGESSQEYILGGDSGENCVLNQTFSDGSSNSAAAEQAQFNANHSAASLPTTHNARLQSLCGITEHMQSIEAQTMELHNRKIQIDAIFMQLHAERMDIDRQLEKLYNIRREQINFMQLNLLELTTSNGSKESMIQAPSPVMSETGMGSNGISVNQTIQPEQIGTQASVRQQERTIRRITPIGGELMKMFKRRRAPSERSTESNLSLVDQA